MRIDEEESRIGLGDDCYLDLDGEFLMKDGERLYLTAIAFRLLRFFAEHPGEIISSQDLIRRGWGKDSMVERDELYVYINTIRASLEDTPRTPKCLRNIRGQGYVLFPRQRANNFLSVYEKK